jgi:uncharacterized integral membrane protein
MRIKTIIIIVVTVLVTIILMKNMDEVDFWIFGTYSIPKLLVLGTLFLIGVIVGWMMGRPKKKELLEEEDYIHPPATPTSTLSDEDRVYLQP